MFCDSSGDFKLGVDERGVSAPASSVRQQLLHLSGQVFDLWQDPQERYDIFMNNFTERTWMGPVMNQELTQVMKTFIEIPPRKLQSEGYNGPITISAFEKFGWLREQLKKEGVNITLPTGN